MLRCRLLAPLVLFCFALPSLAAEDIPALVANPKPHPRLFLHQPQLPAIEQKVRSDPALAAVQKRIAAQADALMTADPVVRQKVGRRLLGVSRTALKRITYLAWMYRYTGDRKYAQRAQKEMLAAAAFEDWNPSHFLDVGEMTAALGIGYDWLYDQLDPDARALIRKAIVDKGLKTSFATNWPVRASNNWGQVCHGGLILGALAVMEDEPELAAKVIARAVENLPNSTKVFDPDGTYPEGPGYWSYGTTYNVVLIDALATALGTDLGISQAKGFMQTPEYYLHVHGPTLLGFNYCDGGANQGVEPAMYWFAAKLKQPSLLWIERQKLQRELDDGAGRASSNRFLPLLLVWADPFPAKLDPPATLHREGKGSTAIAMIRSGWDSDATFIGIKAGSPSASHGHMDIGSFVMDSDGVRWAVDLGAQDYHSLESIGLNLWNGKQDGQRWTVFRLNNLSHNTLVVDGKHQRIAGFAPLAKYVGDGPMPRAVMDMSPVYRDQLARASRGIAMLDGRNVLVQDEIQALDRPAEVRWAMLTAANVRLAGSETILTQDGKQLHLQVLSPANVKLEIYPSDPPPAKHDCRNPGTKMIGFKLALPPGASERLVILLSPRAKPAQAPEIRALSTW